jgi:hypothetical protein
LPPKSARDVEHTIADFWISGQLEATTAENDRDGRRSQGCQQVVFGVVTPDSRPDLLLPLVHVACLSGFPTKAGARHCSTLFSIAQTT